jgi:beta-N-acetylhexosaminidase
MKPAIVGVASLALSREETACLAAHSPAGAILFARNVESPTQLQSLTTALRKLLPRGAVIMVDQEGGRVARLRPPHWRAHPPARRIGGLDAGTGERAAWLTGALIGLDCAAAGFDVVAAPVLDVAAPEGHDVIGDRSFGQDPERVAVLGRAFAAGLLAAGVQPVGKHAPGHGRARADSHLTLPVLDAIAAGDLVPFARNADLPWLMTAHVRYKAADREYPATVSRRIIDTVIRGDIGFAGVLVSDDLAMGALSGTASERARAALAAGCDIALHCSGVLSDTRSLLESLGPAPDGSQDRLAAARRLAEGTRQALDADALAAERGRLLA